MLSKETSYQYREELFRHLDGVVTAPTAMALFKKGILTFILEEEKQLNLIDISKKFAANEGYLNVALRVLASQAWLEYKVAGLNVFISANQNTEIAIRYIELYEDAVHLIQFSGNFHPRKFENEPFSVLEKVLSKYMQNYGLSFSDDSRENTIKKQVLKHIEGILVGPTVVILGMGGMFHKYFMEASFKPEEYHNDPESFEKLLDFLCHLKWFTKKNGTYQFTDKGLFFAKRASAYGVTVSYIPTLRKLDELLFGNPSALRNVPDNGPELHVDREMNVWGSGGAHAAYFKKIDEIIIDIFNTEPIGDQPKGILDMGCGNGAFLIHLFDVIESRTKRGKVLNEHPLFLVGVDYNQTALKVTRSNIIQADIWAKVIWGDIGNPNQLNTDLRENYNIDLADLLNVRTFLDHNRVWKEPSKNNKTTTSLSTGAFAHRGERIANHKVSQSLTEHFEEWKPFIARYGLLLIELHTISPDIAAKNLGKTAATAYDATHGYSDQYIVELEVFKKSVENAGLVLDERYAAKFPNSELATVSINLVKGT